MKSVLGFHISGFPDSKLYDWVGRAQPRLLKVFNYPSAPNVDELERRAPGALMVYRHFGDDDYRHPAEAFVASMDEALSKLAGRGLVWEGLNEPVINSVADAQALNVWFVRFAELLHARGERVAAFSFSTGNPDLALVQYLTDAARGSDYLALHEYCPTGTEFNMIGRYRAFLAALPAEARKPVLITETGLDDGAGGGWQDHEAQGDYLDLLGRIDARYVGDPALVGATVFEYGAGGEWKTFDTRPLMPALAAYIQSVDVQPIEPPPSPLPSVSFTVTPSTIQAGQSVTLRAHFEEVRAAYLDGQGLAGPEVLRVDLPLASRTYVLHIDYRDGTDKDFPASVTVNPASLGGPHPADPHLASFPRPANDNGRGLHFLLDPRPSSLARYGEVLARMHCTWTTIYAGDNAVLVNAAKFLKEQYDIYSVLRPAATHDRPKHASDFADLARRARQAGLAPYIQIFNEPEDVREHFGADTQRFADLWGARATTVAEAGGYPGLQVLSQEFLKPVLTGMSDAVKAKFFFALHNYGANHPPEWQEDDECVLRFEFFARWFREALGFIPPMIGAEGGWEYEFPNSKDPRYPTVFIEPWIDYHYRFYQSFATGLLPDGSPLPDYLFSFCPWLVYSPDWYGHSWVNGLHSDAARANVRDPRQDLFKSTLIDKLAADAPYVRQFTGAE